MKKAAEVAVLIDDHPCEVMRALGRLGVKARTERIKLREGSTDHVVEAELNEAQLAELKKGAVKVVRLGENRVWVRTNGCVVCKLLYSSDVVVEKVKVAGERSVVYALFVPSMASLRELLRGLKDAGVKATVLSVSELSGEDMTERQREVLKLAYKMGYFDPDRKITLTELAERIGVKAPTLEEILRRALRKAVKYYLDRTE